MAELQHPPIADVDVPSPHRYWRGSVEAGNDTGIIYINDRPPISLAVSPGSGVTAAYWEYSITPRSVITATPGDAIWHKWPIGDVAVADGNKADAILGPVTAVRGASAGGASIFEVTVNN